MFLQLRTCFNPCLRNCLTIISTISKKKKKFFKYPGQTRLQIGRKIIIIRFVLVNMPRLHLQYKTFYGASSYSVCRGGRPKSQTTQVKYIQHPGGPKNKIRRGLGIQFQNQKSGVNHPLLYTVLVTVEPDLPLSFHMRTLDRFICATPSQQQLSKPKFSASLLRYLDTVSLQSSQTTDFMTAAVTSTLTEPKYLVLLGWGKFCMQNEVIV